MLTKEIAATHEASHVLVILKTTLRNHVEEAQIFQENEEWNGEIRLAKNRQGVNLVDEFANGLAGPVIQAELYSSSLPVDFQNLIQKEDSLLKAAKYIYNNNSPVLNSWLKNWESDLMIWRYLCIKCNTGMGLYENNYLVVENVLKDFFKNCEVMKMVNAISSALFEKCRLDRGEILGFAVDHLPQLKLPSTLPPFSPHKCFAAKYK